MMVKKCSAWIVLTTFLGGCASFSDSFSQAPANFATSITEDGTKLFDYTVHPSAGFKILSQAEQKGWKAPWNEIDHLIYTMLDNKIAMTGYCRDGYIELDSNFSDSLYQISGECYEAATAEDRTYFTATR